MSLHKKNRVAAVPMAQMDWLNDVPAQALSAAHVIACLQRWTELGLLRHIDSALALQLLRLDAHAHPALLVAAALLAQMEGRGHTCLPVADLCAPPVALLGWPAAAVDGPQGLRALWAHLPGTLVDWQAALQGPPGHACVRHNDMPDQGQPLVWGGSATAPLLYLRRYAGYEQRVGQGLLQRASEALTVPEAAARHWLDRFFVPNTETLGDIDWQKLACAVALRARLSVITGGPGTGKTYTAARLLAMLLALHEGESPLRVALAAPTGKAAARLKQSIDHALTGLQDQVPADSGLDLGALIARMGPARTLHALLGARPDTRQFKHHAAQPLDVDVLIVDEASMVHLEMMDALLQALPPKARLVLLGDKDQLASVEAGAVLGELCRDAAAGRYSADTAQFVQTVSGQTLPTPYLSESAVTVPVLAQQTVAAVAMDALDVEDWYACVRRVENDRPSWMRSTEKVIGCSSSPGRITSKDRTLSSDSMFAICVPRGSVSPLPHRIAKAGIPIPMLMNVVGLTSIPDLNCDGDVDALEIRNVRLSPRSSLRP